MTWRAAATGRRAAGARAAGCRPASFRPVAAGRWAVTSIAGAFLLAACGSLTGGAGPALTGNRATIALPSDAPSSVRDLPGVFSCGADVIEPGEDEGDESPGRDADPGPTCLVQAWETGTPAVFTTDETTEQGDRIFSVFRVEPNRTLLLVVRDLPRYGGQVTWRQTSCGEVSVDEGRIAPAACAALVQVR